MDALKPRRKYTLQGEIKYALARFKHQQSGVWTFVPDRAIVRQIVDLYSSRFLYVKGSNYSLVPLERKEMLMYLHMLPCPEVKEFATGTKLRSIPVFYQVAIPPNSMNGTLKKFPEVTQKNFYKKYQDAERYHKTAEGHHPDGIGWNGGIEATIECVLDVYNSLLRSYSVKSSYFKLLTILESDKYANLVPMGILFACLHLIVRGVAFSQQIYNSGEWRREKVSRELLFKVSRDFLNRIPPPTLIARYRQETVLHSECIRSELRRLRISSEPIRYHDYTKFQPHMVFLYAWRWGIYERMSENDRKLFDMGVSLDCQDFPTMHSVGKAIGQAVASGLVDSSAMAELLTMSRQVPNDISKTLEEVASTSIDKFDQKLQDREESLVEKLSEKASEVLKLARTESSELLDEKLEKVKSESQDIITQLKSTLAPLLDLADSIQSVVSGVVGSISKFFGTIPGFEKVNISVSSVMDVLKYYIVYINTESTSLKMIILFMILNTLGFTQIVFTEVLNYWKWSQGTTVVDGEEVTAEPTSLLEWALSAPTNMMSMFGGVIAFIVKGASLLPSEFASLTKTIVSSMRNFHFIGAGLTGIVKIYDYFKKFWTIISDWMAEKFYGKTPEKVEIARRVTKVLVKIKYFSSEAGMNAIRLNENVRVQAEKVMPEWVGLLVITRKEKDYRPFYLDLDKHSRTVKEIADFLTRFRSVSNFQNTMFHPQIVGPPGIGKSTMIKKLVADLSKTFWPTEPTPSFYSMNMNLEYFDGYAGQRIMIADDIYKMNEPKHLTATIGLITNTPVILPMANLADKGTQLTSEILLSTTNTAYPLGKDVLCMEAVHRRRHMLIEAVCDPKVMDSASGQFSIALFNEHYKNQKASDLPHMRFNLLKPVVSEFAGASSSVKVSESEFAIFSKYARELEEANFKIATGNTELSPKFYFTEDNAPPGISIPARDWTYTQLVHNIAVRYHAFRVQEGSYDKRTRYAHVENCLADIEAIVDQQDCGIDGPSIPITDLIKQHLLDASVPYPSEDKMFAEGLVNDGKVGELDHVDFDKMVDDICKEDKPTSLESEVDRARSILERRKKRVEPPALRHRLKLIHKHGALTCRKLIPLEDHTTMWDKPVERTGKFSDMLSTALKTIKRCHWESLPSRLQLFEALSIACGKYEWPEIFVCNQLLRHIYSEEMIYPEGFGDLTGTSTGFPISFFKDLVKEDGIWCMDVTSLCRDEFTIQNIVVKKDGVKYEIPFDLAYVFNEYSPFRIFTAEFNQMTLEQQNLLVQEANWRNQYTGSYTYSKIREDCKGIFSKLKNSALEIITTPGRWLLEKHPFLVALIAVLLASTAVVWTCNSIANLFNPYPTSKYLHRGPQSNIVYRGKPTSVSSFRDLTHTMMQRNVKSITLKGKLMEATSQALQTEQFMIVNSHVLHWFKNEKELELIVHADEGPKVIPITFDQIYVDPSSDVAIIYSRLMPAARKISHHFVPKAIYDRMENSENIAIMSRKDKYALLEYYPFIGKVENLTLKSSNMESLLSEAMMVTGSTSCGLSGSTVFVEHQGRVFVAGIQAWQVDSLYSPKIAIQVITQEKFESLRLKLVEKVSEVIPRRTVEPEYTDCIPTGAFLDVPEEHLIARDSHIVGDVGKNQIKPSFISNHLTREGIPTKRVPAAMSERDRRLYHGSKIHPMAHSLGKYYRGVTQPISTNILNRAADALAKHIKYKLDTDDFSVLSIRDTILGTREDGSNPMNLKSSPGIPFIFQHRTGKGKKSYMHISEEGELDFLDDNFLQEYYRFEDSLASGDVPFTRAYDFPKDELRPIDKALGTETTVPKTRSVTCMNVFYVLAWRRYTLRFWSAMHRAADGTFPFCPGINPEGPEWNNLYHTLNKHPNAIDFDISNWDGFYFPQLFYKVLDIIKVVMNVKKFSRTDYILSSIFYDVMNCFIQYLDVIYQKDRGLVSGFPGTAEVNTLGHWLLALCLYFKIVAGTIFDNYDSFNNYVSLAIYGDDIILSISNDLIYLFNGLTLKAAYEAVGYTVTSANKDQNITERKELLDCKFLKSTWREFLPGYHIRKMDMDIAYDLVHWVRAKEHPVSQFYDNYVDALRIAFGNGEEIFVGFRDTINNILSKLNKDCIYYDYYDFKYDYLSRYLVGFQDTVKYIHVGDHV